VILFCRMRWTISSNARKSPDRKIVKAAAIIVKGLIAKAANDACRTERGFLTARPVTGHFTAWPSAWNQCPSLGGKRGGDCLSRSHGSAWVANLRAELVRFNRERRNTRHIRRLSPSETVFIISFGPVEAIQAKVTGERGDALHREAERLFSAILKKGVVDRQFRRAYKIGMAQLAAARVRRWSKSD